MSSVAFLEVESGRPRMPVMLKHLHQQVCRDWRNIIPQLTAAHGSGRFVALMRSWIWKAMLPMRVGPLCVNAIELICLKQLVKGVSFNEEFRSPQRPRGAWGGGRAFTANVALGNYSRA